MKAKYCSTPITAPTSGKKQMQYFMLLSFHCLWGTGIFEYREKAIKRESSIR
jgi:hypothetical protein